MALTDLGVKLGLRALNGFASLELLDRIGIREPAERLVYRGARDGTRTAATAGRAFSAAQKRGRGKRKPARMPNAQSAGLFDLTPTDEQQMLRDSFSQFAAEKLRKAAPDADAKSEAPKELMAQASELGITMLGVPEELGGVFDERSSITSVLVAETLAHGDMGLAVAALAPAAVSTAIGLWGDGEQQAKYLPPFVGEDVPAAALAIIEPKRALRPAPPGHDRKARPTTAASRSAARSRWSRAPTRPSCSSSPPTSRAGRARRSSSSSRAPRASTPSPTPPWGSAPRARGSWSSNDVKVGKGAILAAGAPEVYRECVQRSRLAWCAVAVGTSQAVLDYVIPYTNERVAFGEPISNRQAVAFLVADIGIELEGMRLQTYRAASRADQGKDFARQTTLARILCSERGMKIGSDGVGLLGGHGFVKEHPVERWYRDLRAAGLMEGALLV